MRKPQAALIPTTVTYHKIISFLFLLTHFATSCKQQKFNDQKVGKAVITGKVNPDSTRQKPGENIHFMGDILLKNKGLLLKKYIDKYQTDPCGTLAYSEKELKESFEGLNSIGDINGDKITDTVFVVPPFNYCDNGDSYVFFDTTLPRLHTDSYCCHPGNLFSIGDINEDGIDEICIFYSSCSSRFKSLIAYTLTNNEWKQIERSLFDINIMKPDKEKRVRKISKGKFEMLSIESILKNGKFVDDKHWETFSF